MKNYILDVKRSESSPVEPCTLDEAKAQAIITFTDDDSFVTKLIIVARKVIENYCNISIVAQTVTLVADLFNEWELPYGPVTGIISVQTRSGTEGSGPPNFETAASGWSQEGEEFLRFCPAAAGGFLGGGPFRGYFQWGPYADERSYRPVNRYKIVYTTGYSVVPEDLKQAVLAQIAYMYEHRGDEQDQVNKFNLTLKQGICEQAQRLAEPYIRQAWQ